jgi:glycosyltransferase involved in cell wall biosynthesis
MNKILTIVIPTYNMEKYLRYNLNSLIVPEKEQGMLEVLIVNDGSKDSSSAIGHEYQEKYPEVFRVIDKPNGNYGSCVNRGLAEAKGKYIKILDADDSFDNGNLVKFLNKLVTCKADAVVTDYSNVTPEDVLIEHRTFSFEPDRTYAIEDICTKCDFKKIAMHALTYKTDQVRELNYHQTEGISYTDQEWIFLPMINMHTVVYFTLDLYQYMIGREGQTMDPEVIARNLGHYFKLLNNRINEMARRQLKLSSAMEEYLYYKSMLLATFIYRAVLIRRVGNLSDLATLDGKIRVSDIRLYTMLEEEKMKGTSFHYIRYFHRHHTRIPIVFSWAYNKFYTYVKIRNMQKKRKAWITSREGLKQ